MRVNRGKNTHNVVLQVVPNTRNIQYHVDIGSNQDIFRSDPALHQNIGTSDSAGSQYNLFPDRDCGNGTTLEPGELNTGCSEVAIEKDLRDGGIGQDLQVVTRR